MCLFLHVWLVFIASLPTGNLCCAQTNTFPPGWRVSFSTVSCSKRQQCVHIHTRMHVLSEGVRVFGRVSARLIRVWAHWCVFFCLMLYVCVCVWGGGGVSLSVSLSLSLFIYIYIYIYTHTHTLCVCVCVCVYVCVCMCVCVCVCVYR